MQYTLGDYEVVLDASTVRTYYSLKWTGGPVVDDDWFHAVKLGIDPLGHRLAHELLHHLAAQARDLPHARSRGCRILWRAAHQEEQNQPEAKIDEWYVTALTYALYEATMPTPEHYGALLDLAKETDVPAFVKHARWLLAMRERAPRATIIVPFRAWEAATEAAA